MKDLPINEWHKLPDQNARGALLHQFRAIALGTLFCFAGENPNEAPINLPHGKLDRSVGVLGVYRLFLTWSAPEQRRGTES